MIYHYVGVTLVNLLVMMIVFFVYLNHQSLFEMDVCNNSLYSCTVFTLNQKRKWTLDTYSTLIIFYTNSIDGQCHISYEREISPSIRIIASYDLEIHA